MNTRHILLCLALSLLGAGLQAQTDLPQVFSPNAAELGKYGKIPVSYFNGLPNITIPLTELRAKNYTLPIYLTYHAGGNKPDQHPGWVGLGWTLHAGGCINRIVNGMKDEMKEDECLDYYGVTYSTENGYLYNASSYQDIQVDSSLFVWRGEHFLYDMAPDEFQVNFEGLGSSFYFVGRDEVKIVSESAVDYTVELEFEPTKNFTIYGDTQLSTRQYDSIKAIRITVSDGTVYRFGGTEESLDYSCEVIRPVNSYGATLIRTPNTWNITSITFPDGEEILFDYIQAGVPVAISDRHVFEYIAYDPDDPDAVNGYLFNTRMVTGANLSYHLLIPSYLHCIRSARTGEEITFFTSPTNELEDPVDTLDFKTKFTEPIALGYSNCKNENLYQQLDRIETVRGKIYLDYTASPSERLKLLSVRIGEGPDGKYEMQYNPQHLPAYHSRQTDMWGYYSQIQELDGTGFYHPVDTMASKAEILERIRYPAGGETLFDYEVHHYGVQVSQYPFVLVPESGIAGGLRIRKITDISGEEENERILRYVNGDGHSSGICAVKPRFRAEGGVIMGYREQRGWDSFTFFHYPDIQVNIPYHLEGEIPLNQIPLTKGCHVTYSRVEECFPHSGKVVYHYTNHDDHPDEPFISCLTSYTDYGLYNDITSRALSRGLLKKKETFSKTAPVEVEQYFYQEDTLDYVPAVTATAYCRGLLERFAHIRHYTYFPGLARKIVTIHPDSGGSPYEETTEYTYDSHRNLTEVTRTAGGVRIRDTYTYTGDYAEGEYPGMIRRNMIAFPVEHLQFRKEGSAAEKLTVAELTTWKASGDHHVPCEQWQAAFGGGISPDSFSEYTGTAKDSHYGSTPELSYTCYDASGNLILSKDREGRPTTYVWTWDGARPAAIVTGADIGHVHRDSSDVGRSQAYDLEIGQMVTKSFECCAPFTLTLSLTCPPGQNWLVEALVDDERYFMAQVNGAVPGEEWSATGLGQYPSILQVPLSGGSHRVRLRGGHYYCPDGMTDAGCTFVLDYREKQYTETTTAGSGVVFEDFEQEGNHSAHAFYSGKSHLGPWSHSLDSQSGSYLVDYRTFRDGRWACVRTTVTGTSVTIDEGSAPIDHVRIWPLGSLPETYTWWPDGNLRSRTDARGVTESYVYDGLGRLTGVYDNEGNKVEGYQYNYKNR